eukprot:537611-Pleurochrysis_carterae.AAC.1
MATMDIFEYFLGPFVRSPDRSRSYDSACSVSKTFDSSAMQVHPDVVDLADSSPRDRRRFLLVRVPDAWVRTPDRGADAHRPAQRLRRHDAALPPLHKLGDWHHRRVSAALCKLPIRSPLAKPACGAVLFLYSVLMISSSQLSASCFISFRDASSHPIKPRIK